MPNQKPKKPYHNYVKYSSLALQAGLLCFGMAFGGVKLDEYLENGVPIFTLVLSLLGVFVAMYILLKDFLKPKK